MPRALRAFLLWVMVFAMPVQGMAASLMLFCGPSHARMMQALTVDVPSPTASGHAVWGTDHAVHGHMAAAAPLAAEPGAEGAADAVGELTSPQHGQFSCSACAACCAALAPPLSLVLLEPSSPARLVLMAPLAPIAEHQPDGLDRPPRSPLA